MGARLATIGLCVAALSVVSSAATAEPPRRYQALSAEERALALERAQGARTPEAAGVSRSSAPDTSAAAATVAESEVLRVERRRRSKAERAAGLGRAADVYVYDYREDVTLHSVVRMPSGEVESQSVLEGVQLPLSRVEIDRATDIALSDPGVRDRIQRLFRERTGETLEDVSQLHSKAMVFSAETMPDSVNDLSRACGVHRCAQLLLFTRDHVTVEVIPIVDLSSGRLVQVLDF